ncbi:MAG: L-glutamate gamma-semialdehyde dehydrogenase [Chloroflexi bacterium]|nr:L-glutamate gamma-semialdehyde dehydrogenase [Chloroflexota bacterium]
MSSPAIADAIAPFRNEQSSDFSHPETRAAFAAALAHVRAEELGRLYSLRIGGRDVIHPETFESTNPAAPSEVVGRHVIATPEDVDAAVRAAHAAFASWSVTTAEQRADFLRRAAGRLRERRHDFSALMVLEVGKAWDEADGETAEAIDLMEWYARQMLELAAPRELTPLPGEDTEFFYVPLGAGAVISPWNFPLALATGMMTAAVVAGNTVVLKPASASPTIAAWLVDLFRQVGLPDGVINYLTGPGGAIGDALVDHPLIRFVAFTGSKDVGIRIYERAARVQPGQIWLKRVQLEMGGKNAVVVDETADLDAAADGIVTSAFSFQGQKCSAGSRAIAVDAVYDDLLQRVIQRTRELRAGNPTDPDVQVGPVVDSAAERKIRDYIDIGRTEGHVVLGAGKPALDGFFIEPTIIADVSPTARVAQEEIFGPVLTFIRARDFEDALAVANSTEFGLTGSLYSRDPDRLACARREFHVGNLYFNRKSTGALMGVHPFGGFNMSGTDSKAGGPDYLLFFLQGKALGARHI